MAWLRCLNLCGCACVYGFLAFYISGGCFLSWVFLVFFPFAQMIPQPPPPLFFHSNSKHYIFFFNVIHVCVSGRGNRWAAAQAQTGVFHMNIPKSLFSSCKSHANIVFFFSKIFFRTTRPPLPEGVLNPPPTPRGFFNIHLSVTYFLLLLFFPRPPHTTPTHFPQNKPMITSCCC